jgi:hypothetical protein
VAKKEEGSDGGPVYGWLMGPGNRLVIWAEPASGGPHRVVAFADVEDDDSEAATWDYKSEARARARFLKEAGA